MENESPLLIAAGVIVFVLIASGLVAAIASFLMVP